MSESEKEARDDSSSEHAPAESGEPKRALADNTPPNGGLVAWLQVVAAFFLFFNPWCVLPPVTPPHRPRRAPTMLQGVS